MKKVAEGKCRIGAHRDNSEMAYSLRQQRGGDDIWKPFRSATTTHAPQAAILFDKFHIMRQFGEALEKAYLLKESLCQLWDYECEVWALDRGDHIDAAAGMGEKMAPRSHPGCVRLGIAERNGDTHPIAYDAEAFNPDATIIGSPVKLLSCKLPQRYNRKRPEDASDYSDVPSRSVRRSAIKPRDAESAATERLGVREKCSTVGYAR